MDRWIIGALLWSAASMAPAQQAAENEHAHAAATSYDLQPQIISADRRRSRSSKRFKLLNMQAGQMLAYASHDLSQESLAMVLPMPDGVASLVPEKGTGGYYWLSAEEEDAYRILNVSSLAYFSNPGPAPRHMLNREKAQLAITPLRLPREHNHYRAGDLEQFRVSRGVEPVADAEVWLLTSAGTESLLKTDSNGLVSVLFPDDFPAPGEGHGGHGSHGRLSNSFILATHLNTPDKTLVSYFNYKYVPNPFRARNQGLALALLAVGMLLAVPLVRRRKKKTGKGV